MTSLGSLSDEDDLLCLLQMVSVKTNWALERPLTHFFYDIVKVVVYGFQILKDRNRGCVIGI